MLITFSGLDGAGKTTLIARLAAALAQEGRQVAVLHMNDHVGVYAYLRYVRDRLAGTRRSFAEPSPTGNGVGALERRQAHSGLRRVRDAILWGKPVRRLLYLADLPIFLLHRLVVELMQGRILIMDRYFYDTIVDVAGDSDERPRRLARLLEHITPTPDVPVFLDISAERAFERKGEYSVEYLRARRERYRSVRLLVPSAVTLLEGPLPAAEAALRQVVAGRMSMDGRAVPARVPGVPAGTTSGAHPPVERVLVLDAETTQALACARSLGRAGHEVLVAGRHRRPLAAWSRHVRDSYRLEAETPASFAALLEWAHRRKVTCVLPLTERSCVMLERARAAWELAGITVACAGSELLLGAFDKSRTLDAAARCDVPAPPTRFPRSLEAARDAVRELGLPCVVKSRFSSVWTGTGFVRDGGARYVGMLEEIDAAVLACLQGDVWPLVQAWVPGRGRGVFALCDHGRVVAWFAHERLRDVRPSGSGSSLRRSVALDERLRAPAARLLATLRWHGPAMVEFRDDGAGAPHLMEVNGRFWGSLQLAVAAGVDFPRLWLDVLRGRAPSAPPEYREGVTLRWLWGDAKRLLHILAGRPRGYPAPYPTRLAGLLELLGPQPAGTRSEMWQRDDPWPALGEWVQGFATLATLAALARPHRSPHEARTRAAGAPLPASSTSS